MMADHRDANAVGHDAIENVIREPGENLSPKRPHNRAIPVRMLQNRLHRRHQLAPERVSQLTRNAVVMAKDPRHSR